MCSRDIARGPANDVAKDAKPATLQMSVAKSQKKSGFSQQKPIVGKMVNPVVIVPYDPIWPNVFVQIRDEIVIALGSTALEVEHIGSTSVPGLAAKPVIDIDVVIPTESDLPLAIGHLSQLGYSYEGERGIEGRHAFAQPSRLPTHHLYICAAGNPEFGRHIAFRDYLRANPEAARAYGLLKKRLANRFGSDREGYTNAKSAFIADALSKLSRNS